MCLDGCKSSKLWFFDMVDQIICSCPGKKCHLQVDVFLPTHNVSLFSWGLLQIQQYFIYSQHMIFFFTQFYIFFASRKELEEANKDLLSGLGNVQPDVDYH